MLIRRPSIRNAQRADMESSHPFTRENPNKTAHPQNGLNGVLAAAVFFGVASSWQRAVSTTRLQPWAA